jgi:hypothetical protein
MEGMCFNTVLQIVFELPRPITMTLGHAAGLSAPVCHYDTEQSGCLIPPLYNY